MANLNAIVITGDIIGSTRLNTIKRKKLQNRLSSLLKKTSVQYTDVKAEQFRGDSLQFVFTKSKTAALRTALSIYCFLAINHFKIRQSIGVGEISFSSKNVVTSDGSAFRISGENIDVLKKRNELINVAFAHEPFNEEWRAHCASLNFLLQRLSIAQAEALYLQLQNTKQEEIAKKLRISQPSVHQRLQAAGWSVINPILQRFETVTAV
jgi:hypothetical protein